MISHEDIAERIDASDERAGAIEKKLDALIESVDALTKIVEPIADDIFTIKEMTGGWKAIGTFGRFLKWMGGLAAAIAAIVVALKAGLAHAMRVVL